MGVYALIDPQTESVMYVGKAKHIGARFRQHYDTRRGTDAKSDWIRRLARTGLKPRITVLERCDTVDAMNAAERKWNQKYKALGQAELNIATGGTSRVGANVPNTPRENWMGIARNARHVRALLHEIAGDAMNASPNHYQSILKIGAEVKSELELIARRVRETSPEWKDVYEALTDTTQ